MTAAPRMLHDAPDLKETTEPALAGLVRHDVGRKNVGAAHSKA